MRLEEARVGAGELCGSVFLNHRFLKFVEEKTGPLDPDYKQDVGGD